MTVGHVPTAKLVWRGRLPAGSTRPLPQDWWIASARRGALVLFLGVIVFSVVVPWLAGRVFWTIMVASLPLFFVLAGYHRWRVICPLGSIAQLPVRLGWSGRRRAGPWLRAHAYEVVFGALVFSLWVRLVATNGDGYALALFLALLSLAAFVTGVLYTGKTWCNYLCPVLFVEKLYTEPRGLRDTPNSQCEKCTACRPVCPDINEENSYWKEILLGSKRRAYFAFPGVVAAFYIYYYLQSGTWDYYFSGRWTREVGLVWTAFRPGTNPDSAGFFFSPWLPRAIAAALTLLAGGALSFGIFSLLERRVGGWFGRWREINDEVALRHVMFSAAAVAAFVTFYAYAGAPTLRLVPAAPHVFQLLVVTTATLFLTRRLRRRPGDFAEESLARRIIARWPWDDTPPRSLREAFLIHTIRLRTHDESRIQLLELYKSAVGETVNSGVVSRSDVHRLKSLRTQLRIAEADHERIMAELEDEAPDSIRDSVARSPEKRLQLDTYAEALAAHLKRQQAAGEPLDDDFIRRLRNDAGVTTDEHAAVLDRLVDVHEGLAAHVVELPATIESSAAVVARLQVMPSPVAAFLARLMTRRWARAVESLLQAVGIDQQSAAAGREDLLSPDAACRDKGIASVGTRVRPATAARLANALRDTRKDLEDIPDLAGHLRTHLRNPDPYVRATSFYVLASLDMCTDEDRAALESDEHPIVQETVASHDLIASGGLTPPSTLEKMIPLASIGIFSGLEPEDLGQLARAVTESWLTRGQILCREGDYGDEVFVLLAGEVSIQRREGGINRTVENAAAGACIGELEVLDPAPRVATVVVSTAAVRLLRMSGSAFREALNASPTVSEGIIRLLARRLRGQVPMGGPNTD